LLADDVQSTSLQNAHAKAMLKLNGS